MSECQLSRRRLPRTPKSRLARSLAQAGCTLLFSLCTSTVAAEPQEPPSSPIRVSTRLVQASVVVEDKRGHPITGLTKEDFEIFDDGHPQQIAVFSVTSNQVAADASSRPLPADTFSNRTPGSHNVPSNAAVILLDGLNTEITDQIFARDEVVKFLLQIEPKDRVALYTLGLELKILHDFTSDASTLLAALKQYRAQLTSLVSTLNPADQGLADFQTGPSARGDLLGGFFLRRTKSNASQQEAEALWHERSSRTLVALLQIAYHLSALPGRKTLIWVSGNFPIIPDFISYGINTPDDRLIFEGGFEKAAQMLNSSALVVYPVDAHGLITSRPDYGNLFTMSRVAEQTGGRAFYENNDLQGAIRHAVDDSDLTYELGYYPTNTKWDGRFHQIKVRVKRKGTTIRTRKGYLALAEQPIPPEARGVVASHAITSLLEDNRLGITLHVAGTRQQQQERILSAEVRINPHELKLGLQDGVFAGMADLLFIQLDQEGRVVDIATQRYLLNLLPATYEQSAEEGFLLTRDIGIRSNATQLRIVLRDVATGLAGAVAVPLQNYFPLASR